MISTLSLLLVALATAQPRDAGRIQSGEDLAAWRTISREFPNDDVALRAFLAEFPSSPLAEVAYRRLVELGAPPAPEVRNQVARIASSYERHEAALGRQPAGFAVAALDVSTDATDASQTAPLSSAAPALGDDDLTLSLESSLDGARGLVVQAGAGLTDGPAIYLGLGWQVGALTVGARGRFDSALAAGLSARVDPWGRRSLHPFFEAVALGFTPQVGGAAGLTQALGDGYALELALGGGWRFATEDALGAPMTLARLGIVKRF